MKKLLKMWQVLVIILVIVGMIGGGYLLYNRGNPSSSTVSTTSNGLPTGTQLVTIQTGNILNSVSASGSVAFSTSDNLSFNISGTVDKVNVAAGDTVKKGQVLATLQSISLTPLQLAVAQAKVNLQSAQDNLSNSQNTTAAINAAKLTVANAQVALNASQEALTTALTPYSQADIAAANLTVANDLVALNASQTALTTALTPSQADIAAANLTVANAQVALNASQTSLTSALTPAQSDINAAKLAVANAQVALNASQSALTAAQTPYSETSIDAANVSVANAQVALKTAQDSYNNSWSKYTNNSSDVIAFNDFQLKSAQLIAAQGNLAAAQQTLADMLAAPDTNVVAQKQAAVAAAQDNLTTAQQNLANILAPDPNVIAQKQAAVTAAKNNITTAQQNLANILAPPDPKVIAQKQTAVVVAQDNLAIAQQNLANVQPDVLAIALLQAKINDAQQSLSDAIDTLNTTMNAGTTIKAPYDGIMTAVKLQSGQQVTSGTALLTIVSPAAAQVTAVVNEIDFPNIKVGQPVTISVDALSNTSFTGNVSTLSILGTNSQGVVSYPITMSIDMQPGVTLGQGMSATGTIIFSQATNVLVIPNRAIGGTNANPTVSVMVNGALQTRPVTLGITDGTNTQVISGVQAGDRVLEATTAARTGAGGAAFGGGGAIPAGGAGFGAGGAIPAGGGGVPPAFGGG